jgi:hypothetical protein
MNKVSTQDDTSGCKHCAAGNDKNASVDIVRSCAFEIVALEIDTSDVIQKALDITSSLPLRTRFTVPTRPMCRSSNSARALVRNDLGQKT